MLILGIETSCDDTGVAIVKVSGKRPIFKILSNVVSSQIKVHAKYGGVVPNLAAREHLKNIEPCLKTALKEANKKIKNIDLIAVTIGPGLIPSLLIGTHFAKTLAYRYNKPIVGINHLEGHIIAALTSNSIQYTTNKFPAIALIVSGGHTQLVLMKKIGNYKILGETRDDAAGECFDKVAKLLGLSYPGGPGIAKQAKKAKKSSIELPRPMINQKNYDFSFSGLKTAVLYKTKNVGGLASHIPALCKETQQAIIDVLINKTMKAAKKYKAKSIILSGGVAANQELRKQFPKNIKFLVPPKILCTDNAAMIAIAGYFNKEKTTKNYNKMKADANLRLM